MTRCSVFQEIPVHGRVNQYIADRYLVSINGLVFSKVSGKKMSPCLDKDGYVKLNLYSSPGRTRHFRIHTLVSLAFLGLPTKRRCEVNHKDKNRCNNTLNNLEWCTRKANMKHRRNKVND
jgi:hypothetical protein